MIFGAKSLFRRRSRLLIAVVLLSCLFLAWGAAKFLIVRAPLDRADAIVLLSGSSSYKERAQRAAELFNHGEAPRIILTNDGQQGSWSNALQRNPFYYESTAAELIRLGVPQDRLDILLQPVSSTYDEAVLIGDYVEKQRIGSILIVTSAYHARRSLWTFRRVVGKKGINVGLEVAPTGFQSPSPWTWWTLPRGWQIVPGEYFKLIYYRFSY